MELSAPPADSVLRRWPQQESGRKQKRGNPPPEAAAKRALKWFCCNDIGSRCTGAVGELSPPDRSCGAVEQVGDDDGLAPDIMTVNLSKLSLPHHRLVSETRQSSPRGMETAEAEPRPDKTLDTPVVLLDDVVEVFALPQNRCGAIADRRFSYLRPLWIGAGFLSTVRVRGLATMRLR